MYTHIHTIEWLYEAKWSKERQRYFYNKIDGRFLAELETKQGIEYYICSEDQVRTGNVGIYIGCIKNKSTDQNAGKRMVVNHERDTEAVIVLDDTRYL